MIKTYNEGQELPTSGIFLKYLPKDRMKSLCIRITSPFSTKVHGYTCPETFEYFEHAVKRKSYMVQLRFPSYKFMLCNLRQAFR